MAYFKRVNPIGGINYVIEASIKPEPKAIEITKEEYEELKRQMDHDDIE